MKKMSSFKTPILLGFFLGLTLVLGVVLVNQAIGKSPVNSKTDPALMISQEHASNSQKDLNPMMEKDNRGAAEGQAEENSSSKSPLDEEFGGSLPAFDGKRFSVLLVGVDRRPGEKSISNTDSILVASVNAKNGNVALLSIPRDTQVNIPGCGMDKINAAARVGQGLKTTEQIVERLIGQPIDGYVLTNFSGFKNIIDTLGGITVTVEKDMYYNTGDKNDGIINLKKGTQRLNGAQALQYARFRHDALADISRTSRQQTVIKAMTKEFLHVKTIPKLPWLIPQVYNSVETNLSVGQVWSLANILFRDTQMEVASQTLPGNFLIENGISYWKVNPLESRAVVKALFEEGKTTSVFFNVGAGQNDGK